MNHSVRQGVGNIAQASVDLGFTASAAGSQELPLTAREIQILRMLEAGLANREIAGRLCIAVHTVKNHVHSVLTKLGVSSREEAAALARNIFAAEDFSSY